ncbi:MAG TPA: cytidine deaminase [Anaerolineae bacterium]|nr:cytidine deaminase [Anaerolineae bacterium]
MTNGSFSAREKVAHEVSTRKECSMNRGELIALAQKVRLRAYAPYSHYKVGAALLGKSGRVYLGCNVENASYGLTCCAERNAVFTAVSAGETEFEAIAVATRNSGSPCGACRQVLSEFAPDLKIYIASKDGRINTTSIKKLLPGAFSPNDL